jgi:hypothetical protein
MFDNEAFIDEMCPTYNRNFYLSFTLMIIIKIIIIISLINIEKSNCECAKIPERRFLKEWFIIAIILSSILFITFLIGDEPCYLRFINNNSLFIVMLIFGLINYIMLFRLLLFLRVMRRSCECGYGNIEKFLFWYLVIMFSLIALMILLSILMIVIVGFKFFSNK